MNRKKIWSFVCAVMMGAVLTGCSGSGQQPAEAGKTAAAAEKDQKNDNIWPVSKNVEIICPANAGSGTDGVCRALASYWGGMYPEHNFTVTNDASGGYTVAYEAGRNGDADGSTILVGTSSMPLTYYFGIYDHLVTDPNEFTIINTIMPKQDHIAICVKADSPYKTLDDLVAEAKANPNTVSVGTGAGNVVYAQVASVEAALGCTFRKVDGSDNSQRITNVLGGFNDWAPLLPSVAEQYVENGDMRILAICQAERSKTYPDIPTVVELGYEAPKYVEQNYIICATPDMPEEMAEVISDSMKDLAENEMWITLFNTTFKGSTWEDCDREGGLKLVDELIAACEAIDLGE